MNKKKGNYIKEFRLLDWVTNNEIDFDVRLFYFYKPVTDWS